MFLLSKISGALVTRTEQNVALNVLYLAAKESINIIVRKGLGPRIAQSG
jgi:hypothetical protein